MKWSSWLVKTSEAKATGKKAGNHPFRNARSVSADNIEISEEWVRVLDVLENTRENVFITGRAGTGKSTLLQYFRKHTKKNVAVLAFTGVAAVNVRGQTIHSFFGFKPGITEDKVKKHYDDDDSLLYKKLDTIVIDEISMVRADLLDCIEKFLRLNGPRPKEPFGGVQMVFIGDLYQLEPIVPNEEAELFQPPHYQSAFFFDSKAYHKKPFHQFLLSKVFRQKDDEFIRILDAIRLGIITEEELEKLNKRCVQELSHTKHRSHIFLVTTNKAAEIVNTKRLNELRSVRYMFKGTITGKFREKNLPTDEELHLKEGACVMLLNNDPEKRWVNGDIAIIEKIKKESDNVLIKIRLENGNIEEVLRHEWEEIRYFYNKERKEIDSEVVGTFTQYPLRLAWAVTVHKGQGKTFDKTVVDFSRGTFAHGQAYVALSRCTSLEGLVLRVPVEERHIFINRRVTEFMNTFSMTGEPQGSVGQTGLAL